MVTLVLCFSFLFFSRFRSRQLDPPFTRLWTTFFFFLVFLFFFYFVSLQSVFYPEKPEEVPFDISQRLHWNENAKIALNKWRRFRHEFKFRNVSFNATHVPVGRSTYNRWKSCETTNTRVYRQFPRDRSWPRNERAPHIRVHARAYVHRRKENPRKDKSFEFSRSRSFSSGTTTGFFDRRWLVLIISDVTRVCARAWARFKHIHGKGQAEKR